MRALISLTCFLAAAATLYALALAEVLMVNMWEHDIGRYTASNYGILKTVFEVNLQLFGNPSKTKLFFIIRDHVEADTPAKVLEERLIRDVTQIWSEIPKPDAVKDRPVTDFFEFDFAALPHKRLAEAEFTREVAALRERFVNPKHPHYVFNPQYHCLKTVPRDGFGKYAENIWTTIKEAKDLNLPSQREMLASFRCDEISAAVYDEFDKKLVELKALVKRGFVADFGARAGSMVDAALSAFDEASQKYLEQVVQRKRADLLRKMMEQLAALFRAQMEEAHKQSVADFAGEMKSHLPSDGSTTDSFFSVAEAATRHALELFGDLYGKCVVVDADWPLEPLEEKLKEDLAERVATERAAHLAKLPSEIEALAKVKVLPQLTAMLNRVEFNFWKPARLLFSSFVDHDMMAMLRGRFEGYRCSAREQDEIKAALRLLVRNVMLEQVRQHAQLVTQKMRRRFDTKFRYDAAAVPRRWKDYSEDQIRDFFVSARQYGLELLDWFAVFRLNPNRTGPSDSMRRSGTVEELKQATPGKSADTLSDADVDGEEEDASSFVVVLNEAEKDDMRRKYEVDVEGALKQAEAERERALSSNRVPPWAILLILFLGWDEFMWVLRNPLLLLLALFLGGAFFAIYTLNMFPGARIVLDLAWKTGMKLLASFVAANQAAVAPPPSPSDGPSNAGDRPARPPVPPLQRSQSELSVNERDTLRQRKKAGT